MAWTINPYCEKVTAREERVMVRPKNILDTERQRSDTWYKENSIPNTQSKYYLSCIER
jgi:hypothetical protein